MPILAFTYILSWRWQQEKYLAVKSNFAEESTSSEGASFEVEILQRISQKNPRHQGWQFVRKLVDSFTIDGAHHKHDCFVFEPLRESLWLHCRRYPDKVIPAAVLKIMVRMMLEGLIYLHSECEVIHTGTNIHALASQRMILN